MYRLGKVKQEDKVMDWSLLLRQMKEFSNNFNDCQIREHLPGTCKFVGCVIYDV